MADRGDGTRADATDIAIIRRAARSCSSRRGARLNSSRCDRIAGGKGLLERFVEQLVLSLPFAVPGLFAFAP
jgi:hypothetical protein